MRESDLLEVLLVKAIEDADRAGALIPFGDRERTAREALRSSGIGADEAARAQPSAAVERALAERASRLAQPLLERHPVLADVLRQARRQPWAWAVPLGAFAAGIGLSALDGSRRINILAPPFLGLLLWNLLVYAALAVGAVVRLRAGTRGPGPLLRPALRGIGRRLGPLLARTVHVDTVLGEAVRRFAADAGEASGRRVGLHLRRWLHLGAAAAAAGLVAGLYLRGVVLRYEAGWESTFLEPPQVRALVTLLFGRLADATGIEVPRTLEQVAALRWDGAGGGGPAAPWIHLIALCLATLVVAPRLGLAAAAWLSGLRLRRPGHLPPGVEAYARAVLGADAAGAAITVSVTPYAFEPPADAATVLAAPLARAFGAGARVELRPPVAYGEEDALPAAFDADAHRAGARVLLMSLASTPETENHGAALVKAREHVRRARPEPRLLALIDESSYAARFGGAAAPPGRLEERRRLWRDFVKGFGLEVAFTGETEGPAARGA